MAYGQVDLILTSPLYACEIADICADIRNKSEPPAPVRHDQLQPRPAQPRARPLQRIPHSDGRDLIPTDLFQRAQAILTERDEDRSRRASNPAKYLLTGRVRCGRCGQAYVGTAAHGRNGRYTYYTCFTRARYGTKHRANDRLPAA